MPTEKEMKETTGGTMNIAVRHGFSILRFDLTEPFESAMKSLTTLEATEIVAGEGEMKQELLSWNLLCSKD